LLVKRLIPVAHRTYDAYRVVLDGVSRLLKHLPLKACRYSYLQIGLGYIVPCLFLRFFY
jgi:hypothetical protein